MAKVLFSKWFMKEIIAVVRIRGSKNKTRAVYEMWLDEWNRWLLWWAITIDQHGLCLWSTNDRISGLKPLWLSLWFSAQFSSAENRPMKATRSRAKSFTTQGRGKMSVWTRTMQQALSWCYYGLWRSVIHQTLSGGEIRWCTVKLG